MSVAQLKTVESDLCARTAKRLRELAEQADRGEVLSFTGIVETPAGHFRSEATRTVNRLETMGMLFEAMLSRSSAIDP